MRDEVSRAIILLLILIGTSLVVFHMMRAFPRRMFDADPVARRTAGTPPPLASRTTPARQQTLRAIRRVRAPDQQRTSPAGH